MWPVELRRVFALFQRIHLASEFGLVAASCNLETSENQSTSRFFLLRFDSTVVRYTALCGS